MHVSSGLRSLEEHLRIYAEKGITDRSKIPMKSRHLHGMAVDIRDPKHELQKWCLDNEDMLEQAGLYCEHFSSTVGWVHFQTTPPGSGNRFFLP